MIPHTKSTKRNITKRKLGKRNITKRRNGKRKTHNIYKQFDKHKELLIFDLDDTLIFSQEIYNNFDEFECNEYKESRFPFKSIYFVYNDNRNIFIVYVRPYVIQLLKYCFDNFQVAFWSSAELPYVRHIVNELLRMCGKNVHDICFAWGRSKLRKPCFQDAFSDKLIHEHHTTTNMSFHKRLDLVTNRFSNNVILFDNLPDHIILNDRKYCVYIPPYHFLNHQDTVMLQLLELIQKKKRNTKINGYHLRSIEDTSQLNNGQHYNTPYLQDSTGIMYRCDIKYLTSGQKVRVVNQENDRLVIGTVKKQPKFGQHSVLVEIEHHPKYSREGIHQLKKEHGETKITKKITKSIPIHNVVEILMKK